MLEAAKALLQLHILHSLQELWCHSHSRWCNQHQHNVMNVSRWIGECQHSKLSSISIHILILITINQNPSLQIHTDRLTWFINWTYTAQYLTPTITFKCSVSQNSLKVKPIYPRMNLHNASLKGLTPCQHLTLCCSK